jgi:hypothetical protein
MRTLNVQYNLRINKQMEQLLESRIAFFRRFHSDGVTRQFLANESRLISIIEHRERMDVINLIHNHLPRNIRIDIPPEFFDNVPIVPTSEQMNDGLQNIETPTEGSCPICQEQYVPSDSVVRLRNCNHSFHRTCADSWYGRSVYCPLCRNDIRGNSTN